MTELYVREKYIFLRAGYFKSFFFLTGDKWDCFRGFFFFFLDQKVVLISLQMVLNWKDFTKWNI